MKTVLNLIRKEYRLFWSDRVAVSLTFLIPIVLIMIWGAIFGKADSGPENLRLAFLNNSSSRIARSIEGVLDTTRTFRLVKTYDNDAGQAVPFDTGSIKEYVRRGKVTAALVIPADAYSDTSLGLKLKFYYDPKNDMEMQIIQGVLTKTIISQIPDVFMESMERKAVRYLGSDSGRAFNARIRNLVARYFHVDTALIRLPLLGDTTSKGAEARKQRNEFFSNILDMDSEQLVGKEVTNPWATRSVGGWAMMFLLFTLTASSTSLFDEKKSGVVLRILSAPVSRVQILWSKYLYNLSLGFLQLVVLFSAGAVLFSIPVLPNLPNLLLLILSAGFACTAFGMLLAAVSRTAGQANGLGTFLILAMSSIGGAWFPTSFMPGYIQTISKATIVYWSMDGFLQVLWRGAAFVEVLPNVAVLLGMGAVILAVSVGRFKRGHLF